MLVLLLSSPGPADADTVPGTLHYNRLLPCPLTIISSCCLVPYQASVNNVDNTAVSWYFFVRAGCVIIRAVPCHRRAKALEGEYVGDNEVRCNEVRCREGG